MVAPHTPRSHLGVVHLESGLLSFKPQDLLLNVGEASGC